jgi:hypothetical protein
MLFPLGFYRNRARIYWYICVPLIYLAFYFSFYFYLFFFFSELHTFDKPLWTGESVR